MPAPPLPRLALVVAALAATALLPPADAVAQRAPASEIVELRDGSFVRGVIVERVEGSHLVVQTVTGELRRIPLPR